MTRLIAVFAFVLGFGLLAAPAGPAQETPARVALLAQIDGVIGPASTRFIGDAIAAAEERNAEVLVLQLDTPGGLVTSMRDIVEDILASEVPVVGYVAPAGGHAASAGTYILYSTHVAAMAPGTNIGAATPVMIGAPSLPFPIGEEEDEEDAPETGVEGEEAAPEAADDAAAADDAPADTPERDTVREEPAPPPPGDASSAKSVNDAVAYIRSLAELRGRNAEWAEQAVRGAGSITPSEALELNVIEIVADDLDDLFAQLDGMSVEIGGESRVLSTLDLTVETIEPTLITRILDVLVNPNVAFLLMMIGFYGIIFELAQPGTIGPGVIGAISLILGLYALNQLPLNYAGLALVILGIIFMVAEAITPTFGIFGIGGIIAFLIGAMMLFDTDVPEYRLSPGVIIGAAVASGGFLVLVLGYLWRAFRKPIATGLERLAGQTGRVVDWASGHGHVWVEGERWKATGEAPLAPGQDIKVVGVDALTLRVAPDERTTRS